MPMFCTHMYSQLRSCSRSGVNRPCSAEMPQLPVTEDYSLASSVSLGTEKVFFVE